MVTLDELRARAQRVRLCATDCDGVLTDGTVYYGPEGEALLRFSRRDGMGVERLAAAGVTTVIVTREKSLIVRRRAEKLGIRLFEGIADKAAFADTLALETGVTLAEMAYIGDDVNDLGLLARVGHDGLTGAPADAEPEVLHTVLFPCSRPGGRGAFREFSQWILRLKTRG
jgi:3-deoxy-D-manno-octulosonate 8-phosphate phosphatase (KDO 8-P phosphatase)